MTNGCGKSDSSTVPANSLNKAEGPAAEAREGTELAKGNSLECNAFRTQSREGAPSALERVRQAATRDKKQRFTALYHHIYDVERLRIAYLTTKRDAAAGVDGETWEHYGETLEANLQDLSQRLKRGAYRARPGRRVHIPKVGKPGELRPLGVPALEDKIVQRATVEVLNTIYEQDFLGFSYGFRPGRSPHQALDALAVGIGTRRVNWVLDADIRKFYDTLDQGWLVKFVEHRIADRRVVRLIQKWLKAGVLEEGKRVQSERGTVQGGSISPLLANLFLHYAFDLWLRRKYPHVQFERYADDAIVHCRSERQARTVLEAIRDRLLQCGLELHETKTRIVYCKDDDRPGNSESVQFDFLGYTFQPRRAKNRWGKYFVSFLPAMSTKAAKAVRVTIREWRMASTRNNQRLEELARLVNPVVRGWMGYYGRFYRSKCMRVLRHLNEALAAWVRRKYRKFRCRERASMYWLGRIARRDRTLFAHWKLGVMPEAGS